MEHSKNDIVAELLKEALTIPCNLQNTDTAGKRKPLIAVVNSYMELSPGDAHFKKLAEHVRNGIIESGGTPVDVPIPGFCGELKRNPYVRRYFFAYRDFAAAMVEFFLAFHDFDGAVFLCTCDNQVPAFTLGALRVNIPAVFFTGGYMRPGRYEGRRITAFSVAKQYGRYTAGESSMEQVEEMLSCACPTCGACPEFGTANTMCVLTEALGLSLPGCSTTPAESKRQKAMAYASGQEIMRCVANDLRPRDIVTKDSLENAIRVCLAMGGSTNALIHTIAYAREANLDVSLDTWDCFSDETPLVLSISPNQAGFFMNDLDENGGLGGVMKVLEPLLHPDCLLVTGQTLQQTLQDVIPQYSAILRPLDAPFMQNGGLTILKGNLAQDGAVIKTSAIPRELRRFSGKARVFDGEEPAMQAVLNGVVQKGDVVVVRYEGPSGGCGSREVVSILHLLTGKGLQNDVAVITDGRLSGTNLGLAVCNISPEAAKGTALSVVRDGDEIVIDIERHQLTLLLPENELQARLARWTKPEKKVKSGILSLYGDVVGSLCEGARIV